MSDIIDDKQDEWRKRAERLDTKIKSLNRQIQTLNSSLRSRVGRLKKYVPPTTDVTVTDSYIEDENTVVYTVKVKAGAGDSPHIFEVGEKLKFESYQENIISHRRKLYSE